MCGINGIFAYHYAANAIDRAELERTREHMAARGPDGRGAWIAADGRLGLGHRRLSIIDLSEAGAQPMTSADGMLVVTFNGEIYNYRELRLTLEGRGHTFSSGSDTEVLLHLYADKGAAMVRELRGMFAFAIWDAAARRLLMARDPYGIKPLYYADDGWTFRFASQVKALLAGRAVSREPDSAGRVGFCLLGSVPEPFTSYRAIRSLPAGTTLIVDRAGPREPQRFHSIAATYAAAQTALPVRADDAQHAMRDALLGSVGAHLVADVPVGAFLSAGIDSGAVVGLMRDAGAADIQTVTITFEEYRGLPSDEAPLAKVVADHYGTRHTTRVVTRAEFQAELPRIMEAMDQPSIDGINTWFVSKAAAELGLKVAVSGLGGDELLGGYPSFRDVPRWVRALALPSRLPLLGSAARRLAAPVLRGLGANPKVAGMIELGGSYPGAYLLKRGLFMPWELDQVLDSDTAAEGLARLAPLRLIAAELEPRPRSGFGKVAALESALYMRNQLLRDTDWASMAHALEVRVPLVDHHLLARVAPLTIGMRDRKAVLANAPSRALPQAVTGRVKTGFTTPVAAWIQSYLEKPRRPANEPWARGWSLLVERMTRMAA